MVEPPLPPGDDSPSHDGVTGVDLEDALAARAPRRQRLVRGALVVAALVIALGALLRGALPLPHWSLAAGSPTPRRSLSSRWISDPHVGVSSAAGTLGPVSIQSNVSYGAVTLNGQLLAGSPPLSVPALAPGLNTLTLEAAPFSRIVCTVYVIGGSGEGGAGYQTHDPCLVDVSDNRFDIYLYLGGANLSPAMAARALSTLRAAVSQLATEYATVPAGEYYATGLTASGVIVYARASQALEAQLRFAPYTASAPAGSAVGSAFPWFAAPCDELNCGGISVQSPLQTPIWLESESVLLQMRFVTRDGAQVGALTVPGAVAQPLALAYRADGTWQAVTLGPEFAGYVTPPSQCQTGLLLLQAQLQAAHADRDANSLRIERASHTLDGCQISSLTPSGGAAATFIWRFGVLLAADAGAHATLPALPIAPPSAIQAIITTP
jgi:hypothetical protein